MQDVHWGTDFSSAPLEQCKSLFSFTLCVQWKALLELKCSGAIKNLFGELEIEIVNSMPLSGISYNLFLESFSVHLYFCKCTFYYFVGTVNIQDVDVQKNPSILKQCVISDL